MTALSPSEIVALYASRGTQARSGQPTSHLVHAWQCGQLAYFAEASAPLQLACWLHDLGHLLADETAADAFASDNRHEHLGADMLQALWGAEVAEPVRLHVQAKRYLVTRHPPYRARLSPASLRSLALQGGEMTPAECLAFEQLPPHKSALLLRVWDEQAQQRDWFTPRRSDALAQLRELMAQLPTGGAAAADNPGALFPSALHARRG